jgi:hypothetical protein
MPKASIELDFRIGLPGGRWVVWIDAPMGIGARGDDLDVDLRPPLLMRGRVSSGGATCVVDRSSGRLYNSFCALAKHTVAPEQATFAAAVLHFAKRYGFLGESVSLYERQSDLSVALPEHPTEAESLWFWKSEVQSFYHLDRLAALLQAGDSDARRKLGKRISWDTELGEIRYFHPTKSYIDFIHPETRHIDPDTILWTNKVIAAKDRHPVRYERLFDRLNNKDAAWTYLSLELNKRIENALEIFVPADRKRIAVARPRTLLGALYLRLYHKASRIEWERHCKQCGDPLPAGTTVRRDFCDNTCKSRWHRQASR